MLINFFLMKSLKDIGAINFSYLFFQLLSYLSPEFLHDFKMRPLSNLSSYSCLDLSLLSLQRRASFLFLSFVLFVKLFLSLLVFLNCMFGNILCEDLVIELQGIFFNYLIVKLSSMRFNDITFLWAGSVN